MCIRDRSTPRQGTRELRARTVHPALPYHWGTFYVPSRSNSPQGWMDSPGPEFARALAGRAPECHALVLSPGESVDWERAR